MPTEMKNHKWLVLSNTTLGMLAATINASIVLISLPAIFRGIGLQPLDPGNTNILLWTIMGYMVVTSVLVVTFGRLGDMFGRARIYNLGFLIFTLASILLSFMPSGIMGGYYLVGMRVLQGIGGAMLTATSTAILIDVFPPKQRGLALGINIMAAIAGQFIGLVLGGLLADIDWRSGLLYQHSSRHHRHDLGLSQPQGRGDRAASTASSTGGATSPSPSA